MISDEETLDRIKKRQFSFTFEFSESRHIFYTYNHLFRYYHTVGDTWPIEDSNVTAFKLILMHDPKYFKFMTNVAPEVLQFYKMIQL